MSSAIKTIAVDLTSLMPGGVDDEAKIFILTLLLELAAFAPNTQFILLTNAATHDELATMDRPNITRRLVLKSSPKDFFRKMIVLSTSTLLSHVPNRLRYRIGRLGYDFTTWLEQRGSHTLLRDLGVDLLFAPLAPSLYRHSTIPMVGVIHDLQFKAYPEFFEAWDQVHRYHALMDMCRTASRLVAVSDFSRESTIAYAHCPSEHIRTIPWRLAQDKRPRGTQENDLLERLSLKPTRYFLYPAHFWKHKNHEMLFTAFGMLCHRMAGDDLKLVCTGSEGTRQTWLSSAVHRMGLDDRVLFLRTVNPDELTVLIANSQGLLFPSLYEGFAMPVIQAMALGVPVACSNTTSLPEVVGDAAILFNPAIPSDLIEAMAMLLGDTDSRRRLIQRGYARAAELSDSKQMAHDYWALFDETYASKAMTA